MSKRFDAERAELADLLGLETAEQIKIERPRWASLMRQGVIVSLTVRRWRMQTSLSLSDLGIEPADDQEKEILDDLVSLGRKFLVPRELKRKAESAESRARTFLRGQGLKTYWGQFVSAGEFAEVDEKLTEYGDQYLAVRDELAADWDAHVDALLDDYALTARASARRLKLTATLGDEDAFVERFVQSIQNAIPSIKEIYRSFAWEIDYRFIPLPDLLAEERRAEQVQMWQAEADREQIKAQAEMERQVRAQAADRKTELIDGFLLDLARTLRSEIYDVTLDVMESVDKNGRLHPRSEKQIMGLIDKCKSLNFYEDFEITYMIASFEEELKKKKSERKPKEIKRVMQDAATITRDRLNRLGLGESPRSGKAFEVPDVPSAARVRNAKKRLGAFSEAEAGDTPQIKRKGRKRAPVAVGAQI